MKLWLNLSKVLLRILWPLFAGHGACTFTCNIGNREKVIRLLSFTVRRNFFVSRNQMMGFCSPRVHYVTFKYV